MLILLWKALLQRKLQNSARHPSPQHMKRYSILNDLPQSKNELVPRANSPPKHGENLTIGNVSTDSSHPQLIGEASYLNPPSTRQLLDIVKSFPYREHKFIREKTTRLYKNLKDYGVDIFITTDKVYKVLDIAKSAHDKENKGKDPDHEMKGVGGESQEH